MTINNQDKIEFHCEDKNIIFKTKRRCDMQGKLKCAIYTRVSTDNQAEVEFNSCEAQEAKIKSFINSQEKIGRASCRERV